MEMNLLASTKTYCRNLVKPCCFNKTGRTIVFLFWCFISFTVLKRVDWNDDVLYQQLRIETSDTVNISDIVTMDPMIARIIGSRGFDGRELCPTYNLAMVVWSPAEAREAGFMLKTLFFHRTSALHLHVIVTDDLTEKIMTTLMNTWELTLITFDIYKVSGIHHSQRRLLKYKLSSYLPTHLEKVMYVSNHVRFVSDIGELWSTIERGWQTGHVLAVESLAACNSTDLVECFVNAAIVFVDLRRFDKTCIGSKILDSKPPSNVLKCLLAHQHLLYMLPCEWTVRVTSELHTLSTCNTTNAIKGMIWKNLGDSFSSSPFLEKYREHVLSVLNNEPLVHELFNCRNTSHEITTGIKYERTCDKFKYIAHLKRRTYLFYMGDTPDSIASTGDNDVSLMTMLTVDRWNVLERMMSSWKGPASVVFYVTDYEATTLEKLVQDSPVLSKRKRICYHVVYRRQKYNPINYLRNVAINNSATPYLIFVDVDLIPNPNLYDSLKIKIKEKIERNDNHTVFVVPAFQSFSHLDTNLPRNKSQLSWFLQQEIIVGYRMKASWTEGHKPTNFDHWVKATKPYRVAYKRHFEPYVVVPSTLEDRYNEDLLERMQDKIAYTYMLNVFGASLKVLNEDFVVHIPHPVSQGTKQFNSDPDFERCGKQFVHDYYRELNRRKMADIRINAIQRQ